MFRPSGPDHVLASTARIWAKPHKSKSEACLKSKYHMDLKSETVFKKLSPPGHHIPTTLPSSSPPTPLGSSSPGSATSPLALIMSSFLVGWAHSSTTLQPPTWGLRGDDWDTQSLSASLLEQQDQGDLLPGWKIAINLERTWTWSWENLESWVKCLSEMLEWNAWVK